MWSSMKDRLSTNSDVQWNHDVVFDFSLDVMTSPQRILCSFVKPFRTISQVEAPSKVLDSHRELAKMKGPVSHLRRPKLVAMTVP